MPLPKRLGSATLLTGTEVLRHSDAMRSLHRVALIWLTFPLLACLAADDDDGVDPLGELYGTYAITGHLEQNECGAGVPALESVEFLVELRHRDSQAIWRPQDAPLTYGVLRDGEWEFSSDVVQGVFAPDPVTGQPGCALTQSETITLRDEPNDMPDAGPQDAGGAPSELSMQGEISIRFVPTAGSDCSTTLVAFGGPFTVLPCEIRYVLDGEPNESIF